jgi:hypothetical protein
MSAADALGLPPGVRFDPTPEELVEFYLMPRALGQPTAVPGIIIEDAEATTSSRHPWKLLTRNRRTDDDEAYFFERIASGDDAAKGGAAARQDRSCSGGRWTWVGQKRFPDEVLPLRGEQVSWGKYSLNLQEGRRKGGSTGWVMHEYTIASPQCPCPVKLCHVAFTGHGQKRQRVPHDDGEELEAGTPQHKRVATGTASTPASSMITKATPDHGLGEAREQNREHPFPNYETSSSVGNFWGSDAGFSQESSIRFSQESSITILDPWYPDAGTNHQEPFVLDQELAQNQEYFSNQPQAFHQEQFVNDGMPSAEAFCAMLLASGLGSSNPGQEPPSGQPLTKEEQLRRQLDQPFGGISTPHCPPIQPVSDDAAYHEEHKHKHIQTTAPAATADLPLPMDQESCTTEQSHGDMDDLLEFFKGWSDLDTFTDTSGVQDYDDGMAA